MLDIDRNPLQQQYAAWAIGTAVKNSYDFQLWLLQSDVSHPSKLILKTNSKKDKDYNKNINKSQIKSTHNKNDKSDKNDENDMKLSLIPIIKNQTISISQSHNNSNLNIDTKNENRARSMTGIEKLVSLLYHSTNNATFILENKPHLDELQRKVLYAISAAARGNVDVQENLLKIEKSDFGVINDDEETNFKEIKKDELKMTDKIDNSVFMNFLILVAEQSSCKNYYRDGIYDLDDFDHEGRYWNDWWHEKYNNNDNDNDKKLIENNLSAKLARKIWTFIGDMLEERAYIRGDLSVFSDLPEKAVVELSNLVLMGDFFLTRYWSYLAEKTFRNVRSLFTIERLKETIPNYEVYMNGDIIDEKYESQNTENTVSTDLRKRSLRSILESILVVKKEIIKQNEMLKLDLLQSDGTNEFLRLTKLFITHGSNEDEGLIEKCKSLVEALTQ